MGAFQKGGASWPRPLRHPRRRPPTATAATSATRTPAAWRRGARRSCPSDAVVSLAETFKLLGDATRVRILDALSHGELCVCEIAALVDLSESAVSHQLRLLRGLRLVRPRRAGRLAYYSLDDQHIMSLFQQGLRHVQEPRDPEPAR